VLTRRRGGSAEDFEASNPPSGARIYYHLAEPPADGEALTIDIFDADGRRVRRFSSEETEHERCLAHNEDPRRPYRPSYPAAEAGLNHWDWRGDRDPFTCVRDITLFAGLDGPQVQPGEYRARVSVGGHSAETRFRLRADPRRAATADQTREWAARIDEIAALLEGVLTDLAGLRAVADQLQVLLAQHPDEAALQSAGRAALEAIEAWDHRVIQPLHQTYEDEDAWETMLAGQLRYLLDGIEETGAPVTSGALDRLRDLRAEAAELDAEKSRITSGQIAAINRWARERGIPHVASGD